MGHWVDVDMITQHVGTDTTKTTTAGQFFSGGLFGTLLGFGAASEFEFTAKTFFS